MNMINNLIKTIFLVGIVFLFYHINICFATSYYDSVYMDYPSCGGENIGFCGTTNCLWPGGPCQSYYPNGDFISQIKPNPDPKISRLDYGAWTKKGYNLCSCIVKAVQFQPTAPHNHVAIFKSSLCDSKGNYIFPADSSGAGEIDLSHLTITQSGSTSGQTFQIGYSSAIQNIIDTVKNDLSKTPGGALQLANMEAADCPIGISPDQAKSLKQILAIQKSSCNIHYVQVVCPNPLSGPQLQSPMNPSPLAIPLNETPPNTYNSTVPFSTQHAQDIAGTIKPPGLFGQGQSQAVDFYQQYNNTSNNPQLIANMSNTPTNLIQSNLNGGNSLVLTVSNISSPFPIPAGLPTTIVAIHHDSANNTITYYNPNNSAIETGHLISYQAGNGMNYHIQTNDGNNYQVQSIYGKTN